MDYISLSCSNDNVDDDSHHAIMRARCSSFSPWHIDESVMISQVVLRVDPFRSPTPTPTRHGVCVNVNRAVFVWGVVICNIIYIYILYHSLCARGLVSLSRLYPWLVSQQLVVR